MSPNPTGGVPSSACSAHQALQAGAKPGRQSPALRCTHVTWAQQPYLLEGGAQHCGVCVPAAGR